ncbi:MAG: transcriptional repressor [Deferribacteres bacterium]|nr:transcriptional repressor [candidate division KSB1 bacterium]MCB9503988.1 transcriptional repressor [Deferribacteres bacterium]
MKNSPISIETVKNLLEAKGVKPSFQRISVLKYMLQKKNHPSVDMIYQNLITQIPTLSRTTIYNTLKLLNKKRVIASLSISDTELRYDYISDPHDHFLCKQCGQIFDIDALTEAMEPKEINGHDVHEVQVNAKGICSSCRAKMN